MAQLFSASGPGNPSLNPFVSIFATNSGSDLSLGPFVSIFATNSGSDLSLGLFVSISAMNSGSDSKYLNAILPPETCMLPARHDGFWPLSRVEGRPRRLPGAVAARRLALRKDDGGLRSRGQAAGLSTALASVSSPGAIVIIHCTGKSGVGVVA